MVTPTVAVVAIVVFAAASFFFALAETALFSLGAWQTRQLAGRAPRRGRIIADLLAHPQDVLATIVLGNTLASTAVVALGLWLVLHHGWHWVGTLGGLLALLLVGCEVVPKTFAVRAPETWALRIALPMLSLLRLSRPFRATAQTVNDTLIRLLTPRSIKPQAGWSDEDYRELLELAHQGGALGAAEKEIILQIASLDQRPVRDVMQPRARMACIPDDLSVEEMVAYARKHRHRRLPMYDGSPDTIVGVLDTRKLLLDPEGDLSEAIEFPSFVPETMNLLQLLKSLQQQRRGLAIVMDEFGTTAGVVTMEDILGLVLGRSAETGAGFVLERLGPGRWRVSGQTRLDDFRREYPALGEVADVDTMGGLALMLRETVPSTGESVVFRGLRLTVEAADERRVRGLLVETISRKGGAT
jgi:putative hemolysin